MNKMSCRFKSCLENESFARAAAMAFLLPLNPSIDEMMEIKTIISEAVSNAILHGYEGREDEMIKLEIGYEQNGLVTMIISDKGIGIDDVSLALQPLYTTKQAMERSGMGMTIMQSFSDSFDVISKVKEGTTLVIQKQLIRQSGKFE